MTLTSATKHLRKFFPVYPNVTEVSLEDIYKSADRLSKSDDVNKSWVTTRMTHLRHYGLAESVYSDDSPAKFVGVRVTQEGRKTLDRNISVANDRERREVTLETLAQDIKEYERINPSIELNLEVKIKKEAVPMV